MRWQDKNTGDAKKHERMNLAQVKTRIYLNGLSIRRERGLHDGGVLVQILLQLGYAEVGRYKELPPARHHGHLGGGRLADGHAVQGRGYGVELAGED